jgi:hypothetical protein
LWLLAGIVWLPLAHAAVCDPKDFQGAYGFLLTGTTRIGTGPQPAAAIGRLMLDSSGRLSGVASTNFTGLFLGNPVTGTYEAPTDCSVAWSFDDSGNFQHFQGTMNENGSRITFRQSDPGGASDGIMLRTADDCTASSLHGLYKLTVSGSTVDVETGLVSGPVGVTGFLKADGAGGLAFSPHPDSPPLTAGTYEFEDGCFADIALELPAGGDETAVMNFRAIVVSDGNEVLGIQTDPGTIVSFKLVSQ